MNWEAGVLENMTCITPAFLLWLFNREQNEEDSGKMVADTLSKYASVRFLEKLKCITNVTSL